uniref:Uncharacterized protein n=1 Tax=Acanthochromis polyacanthus TaxID=80966 RepID=A0A3Q1H2F1_9TELE
MGQSPSSDCSQVSDTSDSEMKECCQEEGNVEKEVIKFHQELGDGLFLDEDKIQTEGLTDPLSTPKDLPYSSLIECGDVIKEPKSAVPCLLIEGLHEGEPPPDINSLEQNQETAGRDYATEQQWGLATETGCHSGNCTGTVSSKELDGEDVAEPSGYSIENLPVDEPENVPDFQTAGISVEETQRESFNCELSSERMPTERRTDNDSGMAHGLSSDDDGSFRSVGSSTSEIFHPTQDGGTTDDQDLLQTKVAELSLGLKIEETNDLKPNDGNEHSVTMDAGLPLEPGTVSAPTVMECNQDGTDPESQLSPSVQTMEPLNHEGAEKLSSELSKEDVSLNSVLLESEDATAVEVDESKAGEINGCDLNVGTEPSASELDSGVLFESGVFATEESKAISPVEDVQLKETSDTSVVVEAEDSDICVQFLVQDNSEMTAEEMSPENEITVDGSLLEVEPPCSNSEESTEPQIENQMTENPETHDAVDGGLESCNSAVQEVDVIQSEDTVNEEREEENGPAEGTDITTIHRDREASFHQPCNTQHSGSPQSSASPILPSRTSSCPSSAHRDSGSDIESFLNAEPGYDSIFRKNDEPLTGGDSASEVSVSCSSTDDTASVGPSSSSPEDSQGLGCSWSPEEGIQTGATVTAGLDGGGGGGGEAEEEAKDRVTEVPRRSSLFRNSIRSLSPLRRHSWGPGKNNGGDAEMNQRSYSLEGLSGGQEELRAPTTQGPRIVEPLRMPRHDSDDRGSLVSLTEEQEERGEQGRLYDPKSRPYRPLRNSCPPMSLPLTKSVSMLAISQRDIDGMRSFSSTSGSLAYSISEEEPGPLRSDTEGKSVTKVSRTFSYLKNKMYKKTRVRECRIFNSYQNCYKSLKEHLLYFTICYFLYSFVTAFSTVLAQISATFYR